MRRVWTFLHLVLLLTSTQGHERNADDTEDRSGVHGSLAPKAETSKPTPSSTSTENATAGVTKSTAGTGTAESTSVSYNLTKTTSAKGSMNGTEDEDVLQFILRNVQKPEVMVAFGIGVVLTALVWSLTLCCRGKRKSSVSASETLEMVSAPALKQSGQRDEWTQTHGGAEEAGETAGSPEVEYSDIDFSALKRQRAAEDVARDNTESEYAEIKRDEAEEREGEVNVEVEEKQDTATCEHDVADEEQSLWTENN